MDVYFKMAKKTLSLALILLFALLLTSCVQTSGVSWYNKSKELSKYRDGTIFMHVDSPLILEGDDRSFLDPADFDGAVAVHKERTLVPIRAVAEYLGGTVSYDMEKGEATVSYEDIEYVFPIGKAEVILRDGISEKKIELDTEAMIINGRTMVPVRILAEELFQKNVDYLDGVIMITDESVSLGEEKNLVSLVKSRIGLVTVVGYCK